MVGPRITARANPKITALSEVLELSVANMNTMTASVDKQFRVNEKRLFATEGGSGGQKWKPLKKATKDAKKRLGLSSRIMQRTGNLRKGLTQKNHPDHVARHANKQIKVGVQSPLPVYHGAVRSIPKNPRLPRRSVFQMTAPQRRGYYKIVSDYIINVKLRRILRAKLDQGKAQLIAATRVPGAK